MKAKHTTGKMIEIDYKQDEKGNQNVEVIIHSFILVGNVSYFFEISNFFIPDDEEAWKKHSIEDLPDVVNSEDKRTDTMSVYVKIEEPDIFLVTDIGNEDSDALMLNTEVQFQYLSSPGQNSMVRLNNLYNLLFCLYIGSFSLVSVIVTEVFISDFQAFRNLCSLIDLISLCNLTGLNSLYSPFFPKNFLILIV